MIARIWRGWTTPENADAYQRIVSEEVLPSIAGRNLAGYHGAYRSAAGPRAVLARGVVQVRVHGAPRPAATTDRRDLR